MKDALIGVTLEVPTSTFAGMTAEEASRATMELLREKARTEVEAAGGRFDVNRMQGLEIKMAPHALGLGDYLLALAFWRTEVPETVELDTGRPA